MQSDVLINNFNTGEVSGLIESRSDLSKYAAACRTLQNAIPLVEGGAKKMPGTYFAGIAANGGPLGTPTTGKSRLVPFQFSTNQNAILEFFAGGIRVWENGGLVITPHGGLIDYNPNTTYASGAQVLYGSYVQFHAGSTFSGINLVIQAPYGQNVGRLQVSLGVNTSDTLSVTVQGLLSVTIRILLANATAANNSQAAIQAAIRALGSVTISTGIGHLIVDLTQWQACWTPFGTTPPITDSAPGVSGLTVVGGGFQSLINANVGIPAGLPLSSTAWQSIPVPGTIPLVVTTPYAEADLFALDVSAQSADVLYIVHSNYPPATLSRYSDTTWVYNPISGPTSIPNPTPGQLYGTTDVVKTGYSALGQAISAITQANPGVITLASSFQPFNNGDRIYINLCAGMVELNQGQFIVNNMTSVSGGWTMTLTDPDLGTAINTTNYLAYEGGGFAVAIPSLFTGAGNYPACATFFQERLILAGALNDPTEVNGSVQDDFPDFISDPNDDSYAFQFTLVSQQVNQIRWAIGTPTALLLGTSGGVWAMFSSSGTSLSQTNVDAAIQSTLGVGNVAPQLVNDAVIWINRSTFVIRLLIYNWVSNQWEGPDLTRLNREIAIGPTPATSGIVQTAFQKDPYFIFWGVRADGQLIGMTYERDDQVFAWFRVVTQGLIESIAVVSQDNAEDQVWISVQRTINGTAQRYIEYFTPQRIFSQLSNAFFVHAGQTLNLGPAVAITGITNASPAVVSAPGHKLSNGQSVSIQNVQGMTQVNTTPLTAWKVAGVLGNTFQLQGSDTTAFPAYTGGGTAQGVSNQVTGLQYLANQNVIAIGDGSPIFNGIVPPSGIVNFPFYANLITIGLPYSMIVEPMNPIIGSSRGTSKTKRQKVFRAGLSLYQSIGGQAGTDQSHLYDIIYGTSDTGLPASLFTGVIVVDLDGEWGDEDTISIVSSDPFPFTIRSVVPRIDVAEAG